LILGDKLKILTCFYTYFSKISNQITFI